MSLEIPHTIEEREDTGLFNAKLGIWLFLSSEIMLFGSLFSSYILLRLGSPTWPHGSTILNVPIGTFNTLVLIASSVTVLLAWASLRLQNVKKFRIYLGLTIALAFVFLFVKSYEYGSKFMLKHDGNWPVLPGKVFGAIGSGIGGLIAGPLAVKIIALALLLIILNWIFQVVKKNVKTFLAVIGGGALVLSAIAFIMLSLFELGNRAAVHHYPPSESTFMGIYFTLTGLHGLHVIGGIVVMGYLIGPGPKMWAKEPKRFTNRIEIAGLYWHFVDLVWIFLFPVLYLL
jgi:cytochrome c oxidase subunit III